MFLTSNEQYTAATNLIGEILRLDATLPDQVFKGEVTNFSFCSSDICLMPIFWSYLQKLNQAFSSSPNNDILIYPLGEHFRDSFFTKFKLFSAARVPGTGSAEDYVAALTMPYAEGGIDSLAVSAMAISFAPVCGSWAIWVNRSNEICIAQHGKQIGQLGEDWVTSPREALDYFISPTYANRSIPAAFRDKFIRNYTGKNGVG